ncbi:tyrosyl-DNA phosphodiesterase-domain-containing protein [Blastocladiella britannica]|nr:tyrosyl-DNA phosphodiesterase-domain-containing protein [Blastocladiella britannica]
MSDFNKMDRKQMERERLARVTAAATIAPMAPAARATVAPAAVPPAPVQRPPKRNRDVVVISDTDDDADDHRDASPPPSLSPARKQRKVVVELPEEKSEPVAPDAKKKYLGGKSLLIGPGDGALKFSDLVDKHHIQAAILSSFVWQEEWLFPHFPPGIRMCFISNPKSPVQLLPEMVGHVSNVCPVMPQQQFGCMHVKLAILVYRTFVRVVISSANLILQDWEMLVNVAHVHDFPKADPTSTTHDTRFWDEQLLPVLSALSVQPNVTRFLPRFDASSWKGQLVFSRPGSWLPPASSSSTPGSAYGLASLAAAARSLGWADIANTPSTTGGPLPLLDVKYATSSLGALDKGYLVSWIAALRGKLAASSKTATDSSADQFCIVFPTEKEVLDSELGIMGASSLWLQKEKWSRPNFPRCAFHRLTSSAPGYMSHAKTMTAMLSQTLDSPTVEEGDPIGIYYLGSHNFSLAAWGTVTKQAGKVNMYNYELGIVFPITDRAQVGHDFPVPYRPQAIQRYQADDRPWLREEHDM